MVDGIRGRRVMGRRKTRLAVVAGLAGVLALGAGTAYASVPGPTGLITACYVPHVGVLRVIDAQDGQHCKATEKKVTWHQDGTPGPVGPAGAAGPVGPAGPQGPPGAGHVYTAPFSSVTISASATTVAVTASLPPGSYLISVVGQALMMGDISTGLSCSVSPAADSYGPQNLPLHGAIAEFTAQATVTIDDSEPVTFSCNVNDGSGGAVLGGLLTAQLVSALN